MACKKKCICQCDQTGCECWDGLSIAKLEREIEEDKK